MSISLQRNECLVEIRAECRGSQRSNSGNRKSFENSTSRGGPGGVAGTLPGGLWPLPVLEAGMSESIQGNEARVGVLWKKEPKGSF